MSGRGRDRRVLFHTGARRGKESECCSWLTQSWDYREQTPVQAKNISAYNLASHHWRTSLLPGFSLSGSRCGWPLGRWLCWVGACRWWGCWSSGAERWVWRGRRARCLVAHQPGRKNTRIWKCSWVPGTLEEKDAVGAENGDPPLVTALVSGLIMSEWLVWIWGVGPFGDSQNLLMMELKTS